MVIIVVRQVHACGDGVEGALSTEGGSGVGVEAAANAEANCNTEGCDQDERASHQCKLEVVVACRDKGGPQCQALKALQHTIMLDLRLSALEYICMDVRQCARSGTQAGGTSHKFCFSTAHLKMQGEECSKPGRFSLATLHESNHSKRTPTLTRTDVTQLALELLQREPLTAECMGLHLVEDERGGERADDVEVGGGAVADADEDGMEDNAGLQRV